MSETKTKPVDVTSVQHASLAAALAAFQSEVPSVVKGATAEVQTKAGGTYKYQYAGLETITPLVLPLLGKHGLSFSSQPTLMGDAFVLHYALTHESGEAVEGIYPLPDPESGKPQEIGSAITYARRYALCAVTGVAPGGDDDDAAAANEKPAGSRASRASRPAPRPEPTPAAVASEDWAASIVDVNSVDQLRAVHSLVEQKGELGFELSPGNAGSLVAVVEKFGLPKPSGTVLVGGLIQAVKKALVERDQQQVEDAPSADEPALEWPTVEPGTGTPVL